MIYICILEDFLIVTTAIIGFFYKYFQFNDFFDVYPADKVKRYCVRSYCATFPIEFMLLVKLVYGLRWGCIRGGRTRSNFIAYYRIGVTTNFSMIFLVSMVASVNY